MGEKYRIGAATALWIWHDWKRAGNQVGWYRNSFLQEFKELQGYGRTQGPKRRADPTAAATIALDIALTVDRILGELPQQYAEIMVLREVRRMTYEEIADHYGRGRKWMARQCKAAHSQFCALLDGPAEAGAN